MPEEKPTIAELTDRVRTLEARLDLYVYTLTTALKRFVVMLLGIILGILVRGL